MWSLSPQFSLDATHSSADIPIISVPEDSNLVPVGDLDMFLLDIVFKFGLFFSVLFFLDQVLTPKQICLLSPRVSQCGYFGHSELHSSLLEAVLVALCVVSCLAASLAPAH